jgi:hypothetical protein
MPEELEDSYSQKFNESLARAQAYRVEADRILDEVEKGTDEIFRRLESRGK